MRMQKSAFIPLLAFSLLCWYGISCQQRYRQSRLIPDEWHVATYHSTANLDNDVCVVNHWNLLSSKTIGMDQMTHQMHCPVINRTPLGDHSDAAKKVSDIYSLHRVADPYGNIGSWFAAALADGQSDMVLYPSKADAIAYQHHNENYYTYIQIVPAMMTPCEAEVMLKVARMAYDKGWRITDGASKYDLIKRLGWEDQNALSRGIPTNVTYGRN